MPLLHVENLHTHFITRAMDNRIRVAKALNGVDFTVEAGETLGLVGETGAGKSLTALSIMGLLRPPARVVEGAAKFEGKDLISMRPAELNRVRGSRIGMVVQNPRSSLDPTATVGVQLMRVLRAHSNISVREAERRSVDMLNAVGIPDPTRRMTAWPHEFSGGMAQRVLIAMALINRPSLLIADEPTTGLDVTVQSQVLELLRQFSQSGGMSTLIITHDLGIIAHFCDRMAVMFAGRIVEIGPVKDVFEQPRHPYTQSLINSTPSRQVKVGFRTELGEPPNLYALGAGCSYAYRCRHAAPRCEAPVFEQAVGPGHMAACHRLDEIGQGVALERT